MVLIVFLLISVVYQVCGLKDGYTVDAQQAFDLELYESVLDSVLCHRQLNYLRNSSLRWHFLDASGKIPSGIMLGNVNDLGDYFQCLRIHQLANNMEFEGKYCTITVPLNQDPIQLPELPEIPWPEQPLNETDPEAVKKSLQIIKQYEMLARYAIFISAFGGPGYSRMFPKMANTTMESVVGVCIPKPCTTREAVDFFQNSVPFLNFSYKEYFCRLPKDRPFSAADYAATAIFGVLAGLLVVSTSYDLYCCFVFRDPKSANVLYRSFSVYTNTRRILTFNKNPDALECVDAIRALSMMWVVVGHTFSYTLIGYIHNVKDTMVWMVSLSSIWLNSAPIVVDTFFLLSGILAVYTTIGKVSRQQFVRNLHLFYVNRLLRMFPLLAIVVLLQASVFNHVSDGPFWINMSQQAEYCRAWWWSALLHVQNYVNPLEICLSQSWYLSVDVQLYFLCPLVMVFLFGRPTLAWASLCAAVLLALVGSSTYSFLYNFSAALANPVRLKQFNDYASKYYFNTLARASPFFIGMVYGYLLYLYKDKKIRISKLNVIILWLMSFTLITFCIYSIYPVMQIDHQSQNFDNFLNAYMRSLWACALGWLIFACVQGYGGPINWFLSLSLWKLPARLSYAIYLIHVPIIIAANASWTNTHYFTEGSNIYRFFSDISLAFLAAFAVCIAVDAPFSTLQKLLMGGGAKKSSQNTVTESRDNIVNNDVLKTSL